MKCADRKQKLLTPPHRAQFTVDPITHAPPPLLKTTIETSGHDFAPFRTNDKTIVRRIRCSGKRALDKSFK